MRVKGFGPGMRTSGMLVTMVEDCLIGSETLTCSSAGVFTPCSFLFLRFMPRHLSNWRGKRQM